MATANNLSKEQNEILKLVEKYGCLDMSQVYALYEPLDRNTIDSMVRMIVAYKYVDIVDGHFIVPIGCTSINLGSISCIWAMMKVSNSKIDVIQSFGANDPAFSYMCVDNKDSYIFVNVTGQETVKVRAIQEQISKEKKNKHFNTSYVFVTTDDSVKSVIKDTEFSSTVYLALLNYNRETKVPEVKIMKKKAA